MAQLFGVGVPAVSNHLKNIFEEGEELSPEMTISKMETVISEANEEKSMALFLTLVFSLSGTRLGPHTLRLHDDKQSLRYR